MFSIFDKVGGEAEAFKIIERRTGFQPNKNLLREWQRRRAISKPCSLALIEECAERGIPASYATDCRLKELQS